MRLRLALDALPVEPEVLVVDPRGQRVGERAHDGEREVGAQRLDGRRRDELVQRLRAARVLHVDALGRAGPEGVEVVQRTRAPRARRARSD